MQLALFKQKWYFELIFGKKLYTILQRICFEFSNFMFFYRFLRKAFTFLRSGNSVHSAWKSKYQARLQKKKLKKIQKNILKV